MKYKDKVVSNLDLVTNQLKSLSNMVENNSISKESLVNELVKLSEKTNSISEMIGLEDNDFSALRGGSR